MNIEVDTHTHTVVSGHAHSTVVENARYAKVAGLKGFVLTEHGHAMPGGTPDFLIGTYCIMPEYIEGVRIFRGAEANIVDFNGNIDIPERYLKTLDFVVAGIHDVVLEPGTKEKNTNAVIKALNNPYIDTIAHPDNPRFDLDYEALALETKRLGKLVEINNHSFAYRKGSRGRYMKILQICKANKVGITIASDAHICFSIGQCDKAAALIRETGFPEELIVNLTIRRFEEYISERKKRLNA